MVKRGRGQFADEDKKRRELVDARNQGESIVHTTERQLAEHGGKVTAADKQAIEDAVAALKTALAGDNLAEINAKTEAALQASMKLGEAVYKSQQSEQAPPTGSAGPQDGPAGGDDIVDADFEEVDDDGKKKP